MWKIPAFSFCSSVLVQTYILLLIVRLFRSSLVAVPVVVSFFGAATGAAVSVFESSAIAVGTPSLPVPLPFTVYAT